MKGLVVALFLIACACGSVGRPAAGSSPPASTAPLSETDSRYRLIDTVGAPIYCDATQYPVARNEDPTYVAGLVAALRAQHPDELDAIIRHEHLDAAHLSPADNLRIVAQSSELAAVRLTPQSMGYGFAYELVGPPPTEVTGTIDAAGKVTVASRVPAPRRLCPL